MIEVYYARRQVAEGTKFYLHVEGHAGFADKGKDIVCAGVSALIMGLTNKLEELARDDKAVNDIVATDGYYKINTLSQIYTDIQETASAYTTVLYGLKGIAAQYPKNIIVH